MIACVNGHELMCIKGLAFDYAAQICKPAADLKCIPKYTITTKTTATMSTTTLKPSNNINIKSASFSTITTTTENEDLRCTSEQRISPHPFDCAKFMLCEKLGNGSLIEIESSCPAGLFFNTVLKVCDWPQNVVCKTGNKITSSNRKLVEAEITFTQKPTEFICLKNGLFPHPLLCSVYYGLFTS